MIPVVTVQRYAQAPSLSLAVYLFVDNAWALPQAYVANASVIISSASVPA